MSDSEMVRNKPRMRPRVPAAVWKWPKNRDYSYTLASVMGQSAFGGGDIEEIEIAARNAGAGNPESWYRSWNGMAEAIEKMAHDAEQQGDMISARDSYFRVSSYYRLADHYLYPDDQRRLELYNRYNRSVDAFEKGSKYLDNPVEKVQVTVDDTSLPGYLFMPKKAARSPVLIFLNDFETTKEEQYFAFGRAAVERGISCLCLEGPGQGESLRAREMKLTLASESFIPAVVDYLMKRPEIDSKKIGIIGWGLGGYMAARAAAYEKRLALCYVWSALVDVESVFDSLYRLLSRESLVNTLFAMGLSDMKEGRERLKGMSLNEEIIRQIRCPVFILHGRDDNFLGVEQAEALYSMVASEKNLVIIEPEWGVGGVLHNQVDNLHLAHQVIFPKVMRELGTSAGRERMAA